MIHSIKNYIYENKLLSAVFCAILTCYAINSSDIVNMIYAASLLSSQACVEDIVMRPQLGDL